MTVFFKKYYLSILVSLIIVWLSLTDSDSITPSMIFPIPNSDKVAHLLAYAGFAFVLLFDSCNHKINGKIRYPLLLIPVIFGLVMEILQYLVTKTRQADILDLAADVGGVVASLLFVFFLRAVIPAREKS